MAQTSILLKKIPLFHAKPRLYFSVFLVAFQTECRIGSIGEVVLNLLRIIHFYFPHTLAHGKEKLN